MKIHHAIAAGRNMHAGRSNMQGQRATAVHSCAMLQLLLHAAIACCNCILQLHAATACCNCMLQLHAAIVHECCNCICMRCCDFTRQFQTEEPTTTCGTPSGNSLFLCSRSRSPDREQRNREFPESFGSRERIRNCFCSLFRGTPHEVQCKLQIQTTLDL